MRELTETLCQAKFHQSWAEITLYNNRKKRVYARAQCLANLEPNQEDEF